MVEILLTDISLKLNTYSQDAYVNMRSLGFLLLVADLAPVDVFALLLIDARDVRADVGGDILALLLDRGAFGSPSGQIAEARRLVELSTSQCFTHRSVQAGMEHVLVGNRFRNLTVDGHCQHVRVLCRRWHHELKQVAAAVVRQLCPLAQR